MREKAGAIENQLRHGRDVIERARKALTAQKLARFRENAFRLIAQAEERFLAARGAALFGESQNLVRGHEMRTRLAGIFAEGAVAAVVAAQRGERDEDFFGEADDGSLPVGAQLSCGGEEIAERGCERKTQCGVAVRRAAFACLGEQIFDRLSGAAR